jgi:DNA-binding response OmpR family regulator
MAKIMLVDDETDILEVFKRSLEMHGHSVDAYRKPEEALSKYKPNYYDRILLDIRMPGMNGFDLARAMWQKDEKAQVCFMTAFDIYEEEAKKVFKDFNTRCFLKKPLTIQHLVDHVEKHLLKA